MARWEGMLTGGAGFDLSSVKHEKILEQDRGVAWLADAEWEGGFKDRGPYCPNSKIFQNDHLCVQICINACNNLKI